MTTALTIIWSVYVLVNIIWQFALTLAFKEGFIDQLKRDDVRLFEMTVEYAVRKSVPLESAYRKFSTVGLNVWALPIACVLSVCVVIYSHI